MKQKFWSILTAAVLFLASNIAVGQQPAAPTVAPVPATTIAAAAAAKNPVLEILSGTVGGAYMKTAVAMAANSKISAAAAAAGFDKKVQVVETAGSMENLQKLCDAINQGGTGVIALVQADVYSLQVELGKLSDSCSSKISIVGQLPDPEAVLIASTNKDVKEFKHLDNPKITVGCGPVGSGSDATCRQLQLMAGYKFSIVNDETPILIGRLASGSIQAVLTVQSPFNASSIILQKILTKNSPYHLVGIDTGWFGASFTKIVPGTKDPLYAGYKHSWKINPSCNLMCSEVDFEGLKVATLVLTSTELKSRLRGTIAEYLLGLTPSGEN